MEGLAVKHKKSFLFSIFSLSYVHKLASWDVGSQKSESSGLKIEFYETGKRVKYSKISLVSLAKNIGDQAEVLFTRSP